MLSRFSMLVWAGVLLGFSQQVSAGAFYITEIGTPGSLGTAGAANPTNTFSADSSWTNPAGMTGLDHDEVLGGVQAVLPKINFDADIAEKGGGNGGQVGIRSAIPSLFAVKKLSDRSRFGFSVVAPMGGGTDYGDQFVGRYGATRVILSGVGLSPSFAYRVNDSLSLGAGVSALYSRFNERIAINQGPFPDGRVTFDDLDDWGVQGFAGLTLKVTDRALLGLVYRSKADINLEGDVRFNNLVVIPKPLADNVKLSWDNPQVVRVGVRYDLTDKTFLVADADWEDWSEFSKNQLAFEGGALNPVATLDRNWRDTWHVGAGVLHQTRGGNGFSLGASYDSSPVRDRDRTIDLPMDEQWKFSAAYGREGKGNWSYALGATLMYGGDAKTDQTAQGVRFKGDFSNNFILFAGGTLRYVF